MTATDIGRANVSFTQAGEGEPVVLLHCSASSGAQWAALCESIRDRFRPIAPDLYGYGGTDPWPGRGSLTLADEAALAASLLPVDARGVHIVGHSYGGAVALRLASEHPECVRTLTLIEPVAFHLLRGADPVARLLLEEIRTVSEVVSRAALHGDYRGGMECFVDYWSGKGSWSQASERTRTNLCRRIGKVALDFHALMRERTPPETYARFEFPVLLIRGERSPAPTRHVVELLKALIPTARMKTIPGAGHMSPLTHTDIVNAAIVEHLEARRGTERRAA